MLDDNYLFTLISRFVGITPTLITCIIGIVILNSRPISAKAKKFAISGLVLVAIGPILGVAYGLFLQSYISSGNGYSGGGWAGMQMFYTLVAQGIHVAALILLIRAVCHREDAVTEKTATENPYL